MSKENKNFITVDIPFVADQPNDNGDVFCKHVMETVIKEYQEKMIDTGKSFGELGIPDEKSCIDIKKVSHKITSLNIVDDNLIADIEILETPMGNLLSSLMEWNSKELNFQPRIMGDKLISIDLLP